MGRPMGGLPLLLASLAMLCGCNNTSAGSADAGPTDAGPEDGGICSLSLLAATLATDAGVDCGAVFVPFSQFGSPGSDGGLASGLACALAALDAGEPFAWLVAFDGLDSVANEGFVRTPSGDLIFLVQTTVSGICLTDPALFETSCDGFGFASDPFRLPDAGLDAFGCSGSARAVLVCGSSLCP